MENLNYSTYVNNSGVKSKSLNDLALANRPLPLLGKEASCKTGKCNPNAHDSETIKVATKYSNEKKNDILPVTLKPGKNNDYMVLENRLHNNNDDIMIYGKSESNTTDISSSKIKDVKEESEYKMNFSTQLYVGSLTIVGLFVFYRLIQKK
jgi:hypothetical protein